MTRDSFLPRRGAIYVACVTIAGGLVIAVSAAEVADRGLFRSPWLFLAALTLISGWATVKLPSVPATISISETFVFTSVLLYGPAAGATIVALDGLIISSKFSRKRKEYYRLAFNMAAPALSIWIAAKLYYSFPRMSPLALGGDSVEIDLILLPLLVLTIAHFIINSSIIAGAVAFETGRHPFDIWRNDFLWLSLNYFGGASVSALLVVYTKNVDLTYLGIIVPLLLILYFTFKIPMARVEDANQHLQEVNELYLSTIETLASAIDAKDQVTHGHIRRVQTYACGLAKALGISDDLLLKAIEASALLHDMGKLAIPEHILNKPGKLTAAEFEKMKLHASIGADILSSIEFPYPVVPIVRHHHENWDGTGYPEGKSGVDIPIGARILAVVDCFDALTSDRPYRPALSDEDAIEILLDRRGGMYDPLVIDTFIRIHSQLVESKIDPRSSHLTVNDTSPPELVLAPPSRPHAHRDAMTVFLIYQMLGDLVDRAWEDSSDVIIHRLARVLPFSSCAVYSYEPATDDLVCQTASGVALEGMAGSRRKVGEGLSGWVAANRRSILNSDPALDAILIDRSGLVQLKSALSVPLIWQNMLTGVITLYSGETHAYTEYHRELLESLAPKIARLVSRSQGSSMRSESPILGYPGPYHLETYLRQRSNSIEARNDLCLLILRFDPDAMTRHGALDHAVALVSTNLRGGDLVFVCAPTTLVYMLSNASEPEAKAIRERLLYLIARDAPAGWLTDVALVVTPRDGGTLPELLAAAEGSFATMDPPSRSPLAHRPYH